MFKEGQPCCTGLTKLQSQLSIFSEPETNPFECTSFDVEEAYRKIQLLDSVHEGDSEVESLET